MFSIKKDLSLNLKRGQTRFNYWDHYPVLYVTKFGFFDFFRIPIEIKNISKSGLLAHVITKGKFTVDEVIIIEFDNYFTEVIPTKVVRWQPDTQLLAVEFCRDIKLIEQIALKIR